MDLQGVVETEPEEEEEVKEEEVKEEETDMAQGIIWREGGRWARLECLPLLAGPRHTPATQSLEIHSMGTYSVVTHG